MEKEVLSAATTGNSAEMKRLLTAGANPNVRDEFGWSTLMWASAMDFPDIVLLLLEYGANPDVKDQYRSDIRDEGLSQRFSRSD